MLPKDEQIISSWKKLVIRVGAKRPRRNDPNFVFNEWCPEKSVNVNHIKEGRPELRMILEKSLNGNLDSNFSNKIIKKKEFRNLWETVHGSTYLVSEKDLFKWSKKNLNNVNKKNWDRIHEYNKNILVTCYIRFHVFEKSIDNLSKELKLWIRDYNKDLKSLAEMILDNQDVSKISHTEKIELGVQRIKSVTSIITKMDEMTKYYSDLLRKEILDSLVEGHEVRNIPSWAEEIDKTSVDGYIKITSIPMNTGYDKEFSEIDRKVKKMGEIFNDTHFSKLLSELYDLIE